MATHILICGTVQKGVVNFTAWPLNSRERSLTPDSEHGSTSLFGHACKFQTTQLSSNKAPVLGM